MKKITLPGFYQPEPDPKDRFTVVPDEELSPGARAELIAMRCQHIAQAVQQKPESGRDKKTKGLD